MFNWKMVKTSKHNQEKVDKISKVSNLKIKLKCEV